MGFFNKVQDEERVSKICWGVWGWDCDSRRSRTKRTSNVNVEVKMFLQYKVAVKLKHSNYALVRRTESFVYIFYKSCFKNVSNLLYVIWLIVMVEKTIGRWKI